MPKETIQAARDRYGLAGSGALSATELTLHWSKGEDAPVQGYVQLGVTRHIFKPQTPVVHTPGGVMSLPEVGYPHADHQHCNECVLAQEWRDEQKTAKHGQLQMMQGQTGSDAPPQGEWDPPATVFSDELSRDDINHMIKSLRRARDQAFGADA